ncbi:MAG: hypothetical protein KDB00_05370 [Planctomycetales bacterium]|nr:hypothetical protein [Planctomycetales bacterium]
MRVGIAITIAIMFAVGNSFADEIELSSGDASLRAVPDSVDRKFSIHFRYAGLTLPTYTAEKPLSLILDGKQLDGSYADVRLEEQTLVCTGVIESESGTRFVFSDRFSPIQPSSFRLTRVVEVEDASDSDVAFGTIFGIQTASESTIDDSEFFVPAIWYRTNFKTKMAGELATHSGDQYYLFREDRLPLPVVATRENQTGRTVSLIHCNADPTTFAGEGGLQQAVDPRMQFGSLGVRQRDETSLVFMFPGSEGQRNHVLRHSRKTWANRSHPVTSGVQHRYDLVVSFLSTPTYAKTVQSSWRLAFDQYQPPIHPVNVQSVFDGLIETLDHYWVGPKTAEGYDAPGFPFSVYVPSGTVRLYNYQMGFIGRQIPNAYFLLQHGFDSNDATLRDKGVQVIDFWARHSISATGLPRTWYDPARTNATSRDQPVGTWRPSDNPRGGTALRVATTGMEGMLSAWQLMKRHGVDKPEWIGACRKFGDWLVNHQNDDGSYFLAYDHQSPENKPSSTSRFGAVNPIRFLVMLSVATMDDRYKHAALKAGAYCRTSIHSEYSYIGSVIDNPNVIDRETGQEAISAFLALYDLVGDDDWMDAAVQAAHYTETWMYAYDVPPETGHEKTDFPASRSIVGQTVIATGHSAADLGFAFSAFDYYRLYLFTADDHFLQVARLLVHNTKQSLNWDGRLYPGKSKGLQLEAFTVTVPRRMGVMECLSWNYAAHLDPLVRFKETFDSIDIDEIEKLPLEQRREMNRRVLNVKQDR